MLENYSAAVYDQLLSFSEARRRWDRQQEHLQLMGRAICQYGLRELVGIALLHRHFRLAENERLIEQFGAEKTYIRPQALDLARNIRPYLWKVDRTTPSRWYPLEFCLPISKATHLDMAKHENFLRAMTNILVGLELLELFGITWLHRDFIKVRPDEMLVETADEPARTLTWSAQPETAFRPQELTPTTWRFNDEGQIVATHNCGHCYHKP